LNQLVSNGIYSNPFPIVISQSEVGEEEQLFDASKSTLNIESPFNVEVGQMS
jgi:hypothetical protein